MNASLWWPAKIGIAGALCTYLALTLGLPLFYADSGTPIGASDLSTAGLKQAGLESESLRPRLTWASDTQNNGADETSGPSRELSGSDLHLKAHADSASDALPHLQVGSEAGSSQIAPRATYEATADAPQRDLSVATQAEEVQRRLTRYGYLPAAPTGVWGQLSRQALRAFKAAHDMGADDVWDQRTERVLFSANVKSADSFVGIWGADASACSAQGNRRGLLPAVIDNEGASAGETFCAFKAKVKTAEGWTFVASCANPRDRWTTKVRIETSGNRLIWASDRGTQTYTRCERRLITAEASTR